MLQTANEIRLQACLLILFTCSLVAGLLGLFVNFFPLFPLPDALRLTTQGSVATLLAGAAMMGLYFDVRPLRTVAGLLLLLLGSYNLIHDLVAGTAEGLSLITRTPRMHVLPSLTLVLMGAFAMMGLRTARGRVLAFLFGCVAVPIGLYVVCAYLYHGFLLVPRSATGGFVLVAGVLLLGYGVTMVILSRRQSRTPYLLRRKGGLYGVIAVVTTIALTVASASSDMVAVQEVLPATLFGFGLIISYLFIIWRSLLEVQSKQAHELTEIEQRFRSLFYQTPDAVFAFDCKGFYQHVNPVAQAIVGLTAKDMGLIHYRDVLTESAMHAADFAVFEAAFYNTLDGEPQTFEVGFLNAAGERHIYECVFMPILVDEQVEGVFAIVKDVNERHVAQENQRILQKSLESSDSAVLVVDVRDRTLPVVFINPAFSVMTGYSASEVLHKPMKRFSGPDTDLVEMDRIRQAVRAGQAVTGTLKSYRADGTPFWNQVSLAPVRNDYGKVTHYTAIMNDISDKKAQEKRLAYQATHDALTGLGNRSLFEDRLAHDVELARRNQSLLAVLFIDLDEFKPINDTLGHKVGDGLLASVARRLEALVRPTDTLARFGGDEFVLLLPELDSVAEAEQMAERILSALSQPHQVSDHELYVSASIGISLMDERLEQAEKLLQQADMAMYKAKQRGRDTYEIYSEDLDERLSRRVMLRNDLQDAIQSNQLCLNYQPQVDGNGLLCGLEALVRWKHPGKGFISPAEFIPVAEETGQIVQLGRWVTRQACQDARLLVEAGLLTGRMAVNLSPLQFHRPGFLDSLGTTLEQTGLAPRYLELELTEGILMKDSDNAIALLESIRAMGVRTAIDDFGTGFSSFSYLKDLPVDSIKIDRSFVDNMVANPRDAAVCKGVIALAREMGLMVVSEGVETTEQFQLLRSQGCNVFQGYHFARPMPLDQLIEWIHQNRSAAREQRSYPHP